MLNIGDIFGKSFGMNKTKMRKITIEEALKILLAEESDKLLDNDDILRQSIEMVEQNGIVFIDEIDKICARSDARGGDVSREGVQRDLLPLIEGTTVSTKHGTVKTDHILFITSGAFHLAKPADLLPELQGRLPIRVALNALTKDDFLRILTEPEFNLIRQSKELLKTEGICLDFTDEAVERLAHMASEVNSSIENIGARRLHTLIEKLLEDISFDASDMMEKKIKIDKKRVEDRLSSFAENQDLSKFIL
ncbi:MAG: AAA family ATPase, partial [Alphaproteobacteria bacterium]|nr:AAA family ATPase [Alphaproteobacteria bacterium]